MKTGLPMNQLRPLDILIIQRAIEEYEQKYPQRETPSAEVALAWRSGRKGRDTKQRLAKLEGEPAPQRSFLERFRVWCMFF
jgi:hypothetical protein